MLANEQGANLFVCIIAHYWPLSTERAQEYDQSDFGPMRFHNPRRMSSLRASKPNSSGSIARPWRITRLRSISICSALLAVSRSNGICWASCSIACLLYQCSCDSGMFNQIASVGIVILGLWYHAQPKRFKVAFGTGAAEYKIRPDTRKNKKKIAILPYSMPEYLTRQYASVTVTCKIVLFTSTLRTAWFSRSKGRE